MFEGLEEEGERKREREKWEGKNRKGGWRGEWRIGKGIGDRKWGGREGRDEEKFNGGGKMEERSEK